MTNPNKKNKSSYFFFSVIFVAVFVIMLVANIKSTLKEEILVSINEGVANFFTYRNSLVAVYRDNKMRIWDWKNLSNKPLVCTVQSSQVILNKTDCIISFRPGNRKTIVATDLQGNVKHEIAVTPNCSTAYLRINYAGNTIIVVLEKPENTTKVYTSYEVLNFDTDNFQLTSIEKIGKSGSNYLFWDFAVSNDGNLLAAVGQNGEQGSIVLVDINQRKIIWEKELSDTGRLPSVAFSPDGKFIYARDAYSSIQKVETKTAKQLSPLLQGENIKTLMSSSQSVQDIVIDSGGKLLAAVVGEHIEVWNLETEKMIYTVGPGHKIIGSIAFSPDSAFVASSDLRQGGKIQIWKLPKP